MLKLAYARFGGRRVLKFWIDKVSGVALDLLGEERTEYHIIPMPL